jgi:hypothetical protein
VPAIPPFCWQPDTRELFPDICAKAEKWFRRSGDLFRGPVATKHWRENLNDFSRTTGERPNTHVRVGTAGHRNGFDSAQRVLKVFLQKKALANRGRS